MSTTIRVPDHIRDQIRDLSLQEGRPMASVIEASLQAYRRMDFFKQLDEAYERLWSNPEDGEQEVAERAQLAGTLSDGLDP